MSLLEGCKPLDWKFAGKNAERQFFVKKHSLYKNTLSDDIPIDGSTLFVLNVPPLVSSSTLKKVFSNHFGAVLNVVLQENPGKSDLQTKADKVFQCFFEYKYTTQKRKIYFLINFVYIQEKVRIFSTRLKRRNLKHTVVAILFLKLKVQWTKFWIIPNHYRYLTKSPTKQNYR